ncbi:MAG: holo-[acyl-carrier-protein] synthase [Planctomycetes bacterium]|jgi:holo-[acyl-carrier protein] synthase|nr:holo-[acyl-carrier-protein] synthase [Planctomycetota bacterium]MCP4838087.1 holo-[acyl-carrier-protein] synthase [Planctomycetota bacterium]
MAELVHGVDLVEIERIESLLTSHGSQFLERVFTEDEQRYAETSRNLRGERYAARFAAKEAVFKALKCGWAGGTAWTDIGVTHEPGGAPCISLGGRTAVIAKEQGISTWIVSLSHTRGLAMASVIGVGSGSEN